MFTPNLGEVIQFDEYFSEGLKPPTRRWKETLAKKNCHPILVDKVRWFRVGGALRALSGKPLKRYLDFIGAEKKNQSINTLTEKMPGGMGVELLITFCFLERTVLNSVHEKLLHFFNLNWVVVSNIFYFHPEPWGHDPI